MKNYLFCFNIVHNYQPAHRYENYFCHLPMQCTPDQIEEVGEELRSVLQKSSSIPITFESAVELFKTISIDNDELSKKSYFQGYDSISACLVKGMSQKDVVIKVERLKETAQAHYIHGCKKALTDFQDLMSDYAEERLTIETKNKVLAPQSFIDGLHDDLLMRGGTVEGKTVVNISDFLWQQIKDFKK